MSQLGVVMVAENVVEVASDRATRVDVRMRIDQRNLGDLGVQVAGQPIRQHGHSSSFGGEPQPTAFVTPSFRLEGILTMWLVNSNPPASESAQASWTGQA